jgi:hypothetical protein
VQNFLNPIDSSDLFLRFLQKFNENTINLFGNITNFRSADPFHERSYSEFPSQYSDYTADKQQERSNCYLDILEM